MEEDDDFGDDAFGSDGFSDAEVGEEFDAFDDATDKKRGDEFQVLSLAQMEDSMRALITDVADTLAISPTKACMLLRTNSWSKEKLITEYLKNGEALEAKCGTEARCVIHLQPGDVVCQICDDKYKPEDTHAMGCGHRFCKDCWGLYLADKLSKGKEAVLSKCPAPQCPSLVDDDTFKLVSSPSDYAKFLRALVRAYVEDSVGIKWCPSPGCENAVKAPGGTESVKCACGYSFCFKCHEETHAPVDCAMLRVWLDKCRNESETAHWIIVNTKQCPKCSVRIEKNQGCNHITCRTCKHEFCWICRGVWSEHGNHTGGYYKCNRYDPKNKKGGVQTSAEKAKAELDRYLHYYQRYHNHDQSKRFAEKLRRATDARMARLQESGSQTWMDVQFLKTAVEQVLQCRKVLKYTYVFAYFLQEQEHVEERNLFEYLQEQLEKTTEKLSELSEVPVEKLDQAEITNYTLVTKQFLQNLLDGVANGLTHC